MNQKQKFKNCSKEAQKKTIEVLLTNPRRKLLKTYGKYLGKCLKRK